MANIANTSNKNDKVKKEDTFIDMTAMSDMTVLLLTFFMLTATFLPIEPVQVITPASVSETKIAEASSLNILIIPTGKVFVNFSDDGEIDRKNKLSILDGMAKKYGIPLTKKQRDSFLYDVTHVGVPMRMLPAFLDMDLSRRTDEVKKHGVPMDSANNELANWVLQARATNKDINISIKADQSTEYPKVDKVMKLLVEIKENRYSLITTLRGMPEGF